MKDIREKDEIIIEFNEEGYDEWVKDFKKRNPRKRKLYVEGVMCRSLNKMLIIQNRVVQNTYKQAYKDYGKFIVEQIHGLKDLGISSADLEIKFIFPTKVRHDLDNYMGGVKELMDSFTESGLIVEDNYFIIHSIRATAEYEKGVSKMIFNFKNCKFDKEALKIQQEKELKREIRREETLKQNKLKKKSKKKSK